MLLPFCQHNIFHIVRAPFSCPDISKLCTPFYLRFSIRYPIPLTVLSIFPFVSPSFSLTLLSLWKAYYHPHNLKRTAQPTYTRHFLLFPVFLHIASACHNNIPESCRIRRFLKILPHPPSPHPPQAFSYQEIRRDQ